MKTSLTISIPWRSLWTRVLPAMLLAGGAGILCGVLVVDRLVMPNLPGISSRGVVEVPDLAGLGFEEARQKSYETGLRVVAKRNEYSAVVRAGAVITQDPAAGENVKKGRSIQVLVSKGSEIDTVPQVFRFSEHQARKTLREAGFEHIRVSRAYHETVVKDAVCQMNPEPGTVTSREADLYLTVSKGPRPTHAEVPNLIGEMLSEARALIEESGLTVGNIDHRPSSTSVPGTVISQSAAPGHRLPLESRVDLVVAARK